MLRGCWVFRQSIPDAMSDQSAEVLGGSTANSRYSINTKGGYRRKKEGKMDPPLITNQEKTLPKS